MSSTCMNSAKPVFRRRVDYHSHHCCRTTCSIWRKRSAPSKSRMNLQHGSGGMASTLCRSTDKVPRTFLGLVGIVLVLLVVLNNRLLRWGQISEPLLLSSGYIPQSNDDVLYPKILHLADRAHVDEYFVVMRTDRGTVVKCLKAGTINVNGSITTKGCSCKAGWHGEDCAVPDSVWYSKDGVPTRVKTTRLRRLVVVSWFSADDQSSLELLETRVKEAGHVVDVFFVVETNFTRSCQPSEPMLLNHLRNGFLKYVCSLF